ncbi:MAG: hypothetical protein K0S80_5175, partial [Neobacillus sp.]|nr:hypothetical protein [Neobacillus sp.]
KDEEDQFIVGVYKRSKIRDWTVVENRPFKSDDEAYPPPACIIDSISGYYLIYIKDKSNVQQNRDVKA